jgi:hypothetical protein
MMVREGRRAKSRGLAAPVEQPTPTMEYRFPDFICIGAQKAGTTWMHRNLRKHPAVWLPPVKELHYFDDLYIPYTRRWTGDYRRKRGIDVLQRYLDRTPAEKRDYRYIARIADIIGCQISDDWYGRIFSLAKPGQICGELTPEYSLLPNEGIAHVARLAPNVKIILSLRDPIERNWSHIRMIARMKNVSELSELEKIAGNQDVVQRANYPAIISNWAAHIPSERFFVTFMDDIIGEPAMVLDRICAFLRIEFDPKCFAQANDPIHVGKAMDMPPSIYVLLKKQLRPIYDGIVELYPQIGAAWRSRHYA